MIEIISVMMIIGILSAVAVSRFSTTSIYDLISETETLKRVYSEVGADLRGYFAEVEEGGLRIALTHGHIKSEMDNAMCGDYDVVVRGHSHRASVREENDILVINPGEVCGYLTGISTVAFLNTEKRDQHENQFQNVYIYFTVWDRILSCNRCGFFQYENI